MYKDNPICYGVCLTPGSDRPSYLCDVEGDPGRTLTLFNAMCFNSYKAAENALREARTIPYRNGYPDAKIFRVG